VKPAGFVSSSTTLKFGNFVCRWFVMAANLDAQYIVGCSMFRRTIVNLIYVQI